MGIKQRECKISDESFGQRLARLRRERGVTQVGLAEKLGLGQSNVSDYERGVLPFRGGDLIAKWSKALDITADELLGLKPTKGGRTPKDARIVRRLHRVTELPPADQKAVLRFVDALLKSREIDGNGSRLSRG